jgi:hypothetical protein
MLQRTEQKCLIALKDLRYGSVILGLHQLSNHTANQRCDYGHDCDYHAVHP